MLIVGEFVQERAARTDENRGRSEREAGGDRDLLAERLGGQQELGVKTYLTSSLYGRNPLRSSSLNLKYIRKPLFSL